MKKYCAVCGEGIEKHRLHSECRMLVTLRKEDDAIQWTNIMAWDESAETTPEQWAMIYETYNRESGVPDFTFIVEPIENGADGFRVIYNGRWVGTVWQSNIHGWQWARIYISEGLPPFGGGGESKEDCIKQLAERI